MYRQRVLVKSLQIVETFNSVSVIATDKTGTLTQNKMTVTHLLWDIQGVYKVPLQEPEAPKHETIFQTIRRLSSGALNTARRLSIGAVSAVRRLSSGELNPPKRMESFSDDNARNNIPDVASEVKIQAFRDLLFGACICNNAEKQMVQDAQIGQDISKMKSELRLVGDAADTALYNLCVDRCHVDIDAIRKLNPRLKALPFNSANKFMITANLMETTDRNVSDSERVVLVTLKGAPDIVIQRCSSYKSNDDEILELNSRMKQALFERQEQMGKNGYRVIAMCQRKFTKREYDQMMERYKEEQSRKGIDAEDIGGFPANDYCFIGLFSLLDPPRPEVPDSVLKARRAQIRVAMVTGDHPTTAKAIAKQVNIFTPEIADINGVDRFELGTGSDGSRILNLYRNDKLIQQHIPVETHHFDHGTKNANKMLKQAQIDAGEAEPDQEPPWYQRIWASCKNQLSEPKPDFPQSEKMEYIPYAIVVRGSY